MSSASLELKPAIEPGRARSGEARREREQSQTADASGAIAPQRATMSDAAGTADKGLVTRRDVDADAARSVDLAMAELRVDDARPATADAGLLQDKPAAAPMPDAPKDDVTRPAPMPTAELPKRTGQIAVLISRKDGKMYVRQNFAPLFEAPVTIAASDRPLGTHIFTARADRNAAKSFQWSVVSMPAPRVAARSDEVDTRTRRSRSAGAIEMGSTPTPNSAAEALDRLTIPPEAMAQVAEAMASGASIIVSDLSVQAGGETGQGTEFVVPLR